VVGATTYLNIEADVPRLEIGSTWTAASAQRTGVNTESKLLLLTHAFEALGCLAVEFRTHWHNRQSRAAIERLGARLDGVLRNHRRLPDGSLRDTVVYSITDREWPAVRAGLRARLAAARD
jgi:RimJ/RimL family protein N-acetyltransferase